MGEPVDQSQSDDANTFRVLVATDCHLGYMEKDEIRRDDSFVAFEEIFKQAKQRQVDFVLLGGDLFHENKPSRMTLVRCIEILRKYCLGDKPVGFQVVSDQSVNFASGFGHVNYEDPNFNVGIPVFTIHGNHDDPAGVDNLSAIDILSASNLVNYFGKMALDGSGTGQIKLRPVLLRKGSTKLALYGLGNIRDERLNRMFKTPHCVQWIRPESTSNVDIAEWFSIFVLHQNRAQHSAKSAIDEHLLPRFLDFVVWGHEHECRVEPEEVAGAQFQISQPGSSVATSLIEGEAKKKHVLLMEIRGSQWRPTKIPLESVRPFEHSDVSLGDANINAEDQNAVLDLLTSKVEELIERAKEENAYRQEQMLPLIRIRVDYTGFSTVNPQRFGQKFVGKVANPHDILLFTKATKKRERAEGNDVIDESERLRPEALDQRNIELLLAESNLKMEIIHASDLGRALDYFVNKDDKNAFQSCVKGTLENTQATLFEEGTARSIQGEKDLAEKISQHMQRKDAERDAQQPTNGTAPATSGRTGVTSAGPSGSQATPQTPAATPTPTGRGRARQTSLFESMGARSQQPASQRPASLDMEDDEDEENLVASLQATGTGRGRGGRGGRGASTGGARGRGRGRGKEAAGTSGRKPSQRAAAAAASAAVRAKAADLEEDELSESDDEELRKELEADAALDDEDEEEDDEPQPSRNRKRPSSGQGRGRAAAAPPAKKAKAGRRAFVEDDDEEEEDDGGRGGLSARSSRMTESASQGGRKWGSLRR
ncbi:DNA repair exonuclease MRE11 [Klebsormidium nitens]|uniref:Double-strand break repair protein n=1 Tax=Klebsormidium nitens TaxID=105231 RepID=A0A1Y1HVS1_KLENI|nr:DNA repair exonuclease MRE11 [Klebsormidium nitens]|eukprot:GAQ82724.1 DNA repair exonuclease MRE11 [Klebsormidium nitens]